MELPQPPPISSIGSEHERDSEISSTTPHSHLDFFSSRSLSYSLSSASVFSPSPAQPYPETGSDYDPFTDIVQLRRRRVKLENEGRCQLKRCFSYEFKSTQWINCFGTLWIIFSAYYVLCLLLGTDLMFPGSELFTLFLTWFIAWAGGYIVGGCGLPPLLGMLISGLLLRNLTPQSWLMFPENWKTTIRASSLALILMRSGLELDPNALKKSGLSAFRLTFIPGVVEACYTALIAHFLFHMPVFLALSLGFILAAVSPAVVVVGMFDLQKRGYGVEKGIPSLIVTAASFDDIVAISGFTLFIGLAIREEGTDFVLSLLHGPLSLLIGVAVGFVGGITIACTKIWDHRWKRSTVMFLLGMAFTFGLSKIHFQGGGALAAMVMGIVGSFCWQKKFPHFLSAGKSERHADETEKDFAKIWSIVFEPLLFGVIGISLNFHEIQTPTLPKSVLLVVLGLSVRLVAAYFSTYGQNFTFHERLFVALAWSPKATVQAALCSIPLEIIGTTLSDDNENYDDYLNWGNEILTTGMFSEKSYYFRNLIEVLNH